MPRQPRALSVQDVDDGRAAKYKNRGSGENAAHLACQVNLLLSSPQNCSDTNLPSRREILTQLVARSKRHEAIVGQISTFRAPRAADTAAALPRRRAMPPCRGLARGGTVLFTSGLLPYAPHNCALEFSAVRAYTMMRLLPEPSLTKILVSLRVIARQTRRHAQNFGMLLRSGRSWTRPIRNFEVGCVN